MSQAVRLLLAADAAQVKLAPDKCACPSRRGAAACLQEVLTALGVCVLRALPRAHAQSPSSAAACAKCA
jgi:hypothetical protein